MSTIVKAAALQISPVLYSRVGTVERVVKKIRELGKQGVRFATFPETRYGGGRVEVHSLVRLGRIGIDEWPRGSRAAA